MQKELFSKRGVVPLSTYPGRKGANGAWQKIISEIPRCELFLECMCGSAYISSLVTGCDIIVNDLDTGIIDKIRHDGDRITFFNEGYHDLVKRYDNGSTARVFFFDPPYKIETRSYQASIYKHDWKQKDHDKFLTIVKKMKCPVIITHYPCKQYDTALKDWRKVKYKSMTRAGIRMECIYMNFPQPALLQCYKHIGEDFTDRQRIKRKVERMAAKLQGEDPQERAAILSCIIERFSYVTT